MLNCVHTYSHNCPPDTHREWKKKRERERQRQRDVEDLFFTVTIDSLESMGQATVYRLSKGLLW